MEISEETFVKLIETNGQVLAEIQAIKISQQKMEERLERVIAGFDEKIQKHSKDLNDKIYDKELKFKCEMAETRKSIEDINSIITPLKPVSKFMSKVTGNIIIYFGVAVAGIIWIYFNLPDWI